MHAISLVALAITLALQAAQEPSMSAVEADAARVLAHERASWADRTATVTRVAGALAAERDGEAAGRLAVLWMRANLATGCQDLVPGAESLRAALAGARVETTATRRALAVIRDRC